MEYKIYVLKSTTVNEIKYVGLTNRKKHTEEWIKKR